MTTILLEGSRADAVVSAPQQRYLDHWLGRVPKSCSVVAAFARSPSSTSTPGLYGKKSPLCLARQKSGGSCQNFLLPDQQVGHDAEAFSVWDDQGTNSYRVTRGNGTGLSRSTAFPSISDWAASTTRFPDQFGILLHGAGEVDCLLSAATPSAAASKPTTTAFLSPSSSIVLIAANAISSFRAKTPRTILFVGPDSQVHR